MYSFIQLVGYGFAAGLGFWLATWVVSVFLLLFWGVSIRLGFREKGN